MKSIEQFSNDHVHVMLVGTKSDMHEKCMITPEQATSLAAMYQMEYFETSAKVDTKVQEAFTAMAHAICNSKSAIGAVHKEKAPTVQLTSGSTRETKQQVQRNCCR